MANEQSPAPAAPAAAAPASVSTGTGSIGASLDAEIVLVKSRIAKLEAAGKTDWANVVAWVKSNWAHFVTWAALAASSPLGAAIVKHFV